MRERKTKKHQQYSIEEKNQIVLLYLDKHLRQSDIRRQYDIGSKSVLQNWIKQYLEFGTCMDRRGLGTSAEFPKKGRPKKNTLPLEEMSKKDLIDKVKMYQDIKKSLVYLMKQQSNNTIK
ncbi:transposase [Mycoplasmatota bacterium WC30]